MITKKDEKILEKKGLKKSDIDYQLELLKKGTKHIILKRPAIINDGILSFSESEISHYLRLYDDYLSEGKKVMKFVPASGAATRMFKEFFACYNKGCKSIDEYPTVKTFFEKLNLFAFFEILDAGLKSKTGKDLKVLLSEKNYLVVVDYLLNDKGLNYGHTPKGLIFFHRYKDSIRTAFEEHLHEGVKHISSKNFAYFHFTISPEFEKKFSEVAANYETLDGVKLDISFSKQYGSTDTIAIYDDFSLVRKANGELLFRPGGHGSLLKNLASLEADLIFIKNIDNIAHGDYLDFSVKYKKLLGGVAIEIKEKLVRLIERLNKEGALALFDVKNFVKKYFFADTLPKFDDENEEIAFYKRFLNRPLRVAGMVRNEGEPGGGPFWVEYKDKGFSTLQIVEKSQINVSDSLQKEILDASTHFNPVDMVVMFDKRHNLYDYVDNDAYFISEKSFEGKNIKALEWPGLWNGAMSDWLTVFVEIPLETFNPVKVVIDLLRKYHLPKEK